MADRSTPGEDKPLGIERAIIERIGQDFDGECHLTEAEARQAADTILILKAENDALRERLNQILDAHLHSTSDADGMDRIEAILDPALSTNPSASASVPFDTV